MYKFIFLRHGRSLADDEEKIEGRYDSPLTEIGIAQAQKTALHFIESGYKFDSIITSTLIRASRTAEIINNSFKIPLVKSELFIERDNGVLAGLGRKEADIKYPMKGFKTPFSYFPNLSGENLITLQGRALLALDFILKNNPGQYLIVSHGGFLNAIIRTILGISSPINNSGCIFQFQDNGYIEIDYYENDYKWVIKKLR